MLLNARAPYLGEQFDFSWHPHANKVTLDPLTNNAITPICQKELCKCPKGILDDYDSSWNGETAVTATCTSDRRYGRSGVVLMALGAYAVMLSLQLFVRANNSRFYMVDPKKA